MAHIVDAERPRRTHDRSVRLEDDTWDELARLAVDTDLPVSWHIRRALRRYLAAPQAPLLSRTPDEPAP